MLVRSCEKVFCKVTQNLYNSIGVTVNSDTAIKPFNQFKAVLCMLALPFWYSIARSNADTTKPTANKAQPKNEKSRTTALTQSRSNISAPIPVMLEKKSASALYMIS